jgi:hypothetical protein
MRLGRYFAYAVLAGLAVAGSPLLASLDLPVLSVTTYGRRYQVFELFGFCQSVVLIAIGYFEIRRCPVTSFHQACLAVVPILVSFFYLTMIVEYSLKTYDFSAYEGAARSILAGTNPYLQSGSAAEYLYPPLVAQCLAGFYRVWRWGSVSAGMSLDENTLWDLVFYFYQCGQYWMIILAYQLSRRFSTLLGLSRWEALWLVTALFLFNNPLIRTVRHNQVNLYVLNTILVALILLPKHPFVSGLSLSLGGHLKLYPLLLGLPLFLARKWTSVLGLFCGFGFVLLIQTGGHDSGVWNQFLGYLPFVQRPTAFRNNSLHSLAYNLVRFVGLPRATFQYVEIFLSVAIVIWFAIRYLQRENTSRTGNESIPGTFRLWGHLVDFSALMLIISPSVWEHHYVLAMPVAIWAWHCRDTGAGALWLLGGCMFAMFALPTFDVFPLSYHRLLGLVLLLWLTSPRSTSALHHPRSLQHV